MHPTPKSKSHLTTLLLFALLFLNCAKDNDLYFELAKYEETEELNEEESSDNENSESEEQEPTTDDSSSNNPNLNHPIEGAFYVTSNGSSSNDGKSEFSPWSLEHAVNNAQLVMLYM